MNKSWFSKSFVIPFLLWILFSIRVFPHDIWLTVKKTLYMLIGSLLYGLGMTLIFNGLNSKINKKSLSRENFVKMVLWLAVLTSFSASMDHYFFKK